MFVCVPASFRACSYIYVPLQLDFNFQKVISLIHTHTVRCADYHFDVNQTLMSILSICIYRNCPFVFHSQPFSYPPFLHVKHYKKQCIITTYYYIYIPNQMCHFYAGELLLLSCRYLILVL